MRSHLPHTPELGVSVRTRPSKQIFAPLRRTRELVLPEPQWRGRAAELPEAVWIGGLIAIMVAATLLRVWGLQNGLPFVYNVDEAGHFVPKAIGFFNDLNPHYFQNPPALSYLFYAVFTVWFGGREGASAALATNPEALFTVARATVVVLGVAAVGLTAGLGARLYDRRVGLISGAIFAVAFLPVFYSHLAVNDVPALVPLVLSLYGSAGIVTRQRGRDWIYAGVGLGLAVATKYTAGVVALPLLIAALVAFSRRDADRLRVALWGLAAGLLAVGCFLLANPWSVLSFSEWRVELADQSQASSAPKLGLPEQNGILYYLSSLTWSLGWAPALAALAGVAIAFKLEWRRALVLVGYALAFLLYMGTFERYFGRWMLPIFPALAVLAALTAVVLTDRLRTRSVWTGRAALALVALGLAVQGVVLSVHSDLVLAREDTRSLAREWMVRNLPVGTKVVIEPVVPGSWVFDPNRALPGHPNGRWDRFLVQQEEVDAAARRARDQGVRKLVFPEGYEYVLTPGLIERYERGGYCWVMAGSSQYGRAFADPEAVPEALRYYQALREQGQVAYEVSPYRPGTAPQGFDFDRTTTYHPLNYERTGPSIIIFRLNGGACKKS
jgi:4-amino-4-deoxy-L-arabinose transferase-like glycosyltransferase